MSIFEEAREPPFKLPGVESRDDLASHAVFTVAKASTQAPDFAVGLALAAHISHANEAISVVVIPRYLEADPKVETQLRNQTKLVEGGVVLGQTGIVSEDTRGLLREVLTSADRRGRFAELRTGLGSLQAVVAAILTLFGLAAASRAVPEVRDAARDVKDAVKNGLALAVGSPLRGKRQHERDSEAPPGSGHKADKEAKDIGDLKPSQDEPDAVEDRHTPRRRSVVFLVAGLTPGENVTVWLRTGWRVSGTVAELGNPAEKSFLRLTDARIARAQLPTKQELPEGTPGASPEATAEALIPIADVEVIQLSAEDAAPREA